MTAPTVSTAAPVKTEPTDLGVDVPVTTPAWVIKAASVLVLAAGPFLNWWNPYHISSSSARAAIVCVFGVVAGAIFIAQTGMAAVHKYGFTKAAVQAAYMADKDEVKALVDELTPIAAQAQPVIAGITNHEPRLAALETKVTDLVREVEERWAATPDKGDLIAALKLLTGDNPPTTQPTQPTPTPAPAAAPTVDVAVQ